MNTEHPSDTQTGPAPAETLGERRVAFERLRERTDELELIISGISLVALLALPGWLAERWIQSELHFEGARNLLVGIAFQMGVGLSYTMAGAFVLHLATRAYWVGLIGLKVTFPGGVRWSNVRSFGPIARDHYRGRMTDLDAAIDRADRLASVVFAFISLVVLSLFWFGLVIAFFIVFVTALGAVFDFGESVSIHVFLGLMGGIVGVALLINLLDSRWMPWHRAGREPGRFVRGLIGRLLAVQAIFIPPRLVLPVLLSLESNLPKRSFSVMFFLLILASMSFGVVQQKLSREFAMFGSYDFMTDVDVDAGLRTAHYENQRGESDRMFRVPLIPSDMVADAFLRVFLPHVPDRDNVLLRSQCPPVPDGAQRHACLAGLWALSLEGRTIDVAAFIAAERRDIGLRGLQGYIPMAGLAPGQHELVAIWNPHGGDSGKRRKREYRIPFWFAPPYQLDLEPAAVAIQP